MIITLAHEQELATMARQPNLTWNEIVVSNVYREMETAIKLDAARLLQIDPGMGLLFSIASYVPNLTAIDLSNNDLGCYKSVVRFLGEICLSQTLRAIDLSGNRLGKCDSAVGEIIAKSGVNTLNISYNTLAEHSLIVVAHLSQSKTLHTLDISANSLGIHGTGQLHEI